MLRRIELWDEVRKEFSLADVKNKKIVHERCPKCGHEKMHHYDFIDAHWRKCARGVCDYVEQLELWELTCSCGKEPPIKKSPNVHYVQCANYVLPNIPPGAVLFKNITKNTPS